MVDDETGLIKVVLIFFSAAVLACICNLKHVDCAGKVNQKEKDLEVNGSESLSFSMMLY